MRWPLYKNIDVNTWEMRLNSVLAESQIEKILSYADITGSKSAEVLSTDNTKDSSVRRSKILFLDFNEFSDIYACIQESVRYVNDNYYKWRLDSLEGLQYAEYSSTDQGFYACHTDSSLKGYGGSVRKLSFSILLSDDFEGGDLKFHNFDQGHTINLNKGDAVFFPSFMPHSVEPVTKGIRKSLVGWIQGPDFV